jgi:lipoprotein-anchoring transpeptidase ErfK/SrfK
MARRGVASAAGLVVVAAVAGAAAAPPVLAGKAPAGGTTQELAALSGAHAIFSRVHGRRTRTGTVQGSRPITGVETVLPVFGHTTTRGGRRWLRVSIPGRPNSRKAWISRRGTVRMTTPWRLAVRTADRRVRVYHHGRLIRSFSAVVGKPSTPTPQGRFFVEENVRMLSGAAGAPYALALSARSNVLQEFEGGPGQIAMHGVANLGGIPGTAVSHGCVRLANSNIRWLAARIGPGTPVTITR